MDWLSCDGRKIPAACKDKLSRVAWRIARYCKIHKKKNQITSQHELENDKKSCSVENKLSISIWHNFEVISLTNP